MPLRTPLPRDFDALPHGVRAHPLPASADARGEVVAMFDATATASPWRQWNLVRSAPGVLRGMHIHLDRDDYIVMLAGRMRLGLMDLRGGSPTRGLRSLVTLDAAVPQAIEIPVGVLHGFHFPDGGVHAYGLSEGWLPHRDIGCRWDDPDLALPWDADAEPIVVERDLRLGTLAALVRRETAFAALPGLAA